ncbi:hypothetical protein A2W24_02640 [Microgenomates group bacterium RBG_16_45_19]|nr:MAG: hypothetical protein A2W24_02640 [Microgenomates group bacterium RBG_16_45_19]
MNPVERRLFRQWVGFGILAIAIVTSACGGDISKRPIYEGPDPTTSIVCEGMDDHILKTGKFEVLPVGGSGEIRMDEVVVVEDLNSNGVPDLPNEVCVGWQVH